MSIRSGAGSCAAAPPVRATSTARTRASQRVIAASIRRPVALRRVRPLGHTGGPVEILSDASLARLAAVPLFASLDRVELARLAAEISVVTADPGAVLLREGALGDRMYVIESGAVQVYATGFDATD